MSKNITPHPKDLKPEWMAYSGMAAAFLAVGAKVDGQVIYTDVDPDMALIGSQLDIDFDMDGNIDVTVVHIHTSSSGVMYDIGAVQGNIDGFTSNSYVYANVIAAGGAIDPSNPGWQDSVGFGTLAYRIFTSSSAGSFGPWFGQDGYLGCRFTDGGGSTHYAWVHLQVGAVAEQVTVLGYAYEQTPDMGIAAGAGEATGIANTPSPLGLEVFPDPVQNMATVRITTAQEGRVSVQVVNGMGQVMVQRETATSAGTRTLDLDLSALPAGTYFVSLRSGKRVVHQKVTKVG
ncbi:MAG: T9SS type A sorting domain-containing protein [Flavobacteriales bacterium]|nr:T9SS type A sorting domain-containing protein [Flavobacteriales bacterium]